MADKIDFTCQKCGQQMNIDEAQAGTLIDCPICRGQVLVPPAPVEGYAKPVVREDWKTNTGDGATVIVSDVRISWGSAFEIVLKFTVCAAAIGLIIGFAIGVLALLVGGIRP